MQDDWFNWRHWRVLVIEGVNGGGIAVDPRLCAPYRYRKVQAGDP